MDKLIPLPYLKFIMTCVFSFIAITSVKEVAKWYLERPVQEIHAIDCKHVIAGTKPFLFHGVVVHQEHVVIDDYQVRTDVPSMKFNAVFIKSQKGEYLMMYTQYSEVYPAIDGIEVIGWFVNLPNETISGFNGVGVGKIPANRFPISYPITVETVPKEALFTVK